MKNKKGMYVIDKDYHILYMNERVKELYPTVRVGDICYKSLGKEDSPCSRCPIYNKKNESIFFNNKTSEWISSTSVDVDCEGKGGCTCLVFRQWKELSYGDAIRNNDVADKIKYITECNPSQGIVCAYFDDTLPVVYANNIFINMLGYDSYEEFMKSSKGLLINILSKSDIVNASQYSKRLVNDGLVYSTIYDVLCKDGEYIKVIAKGQIFKNTEERLMVISQVADLNDTLSAQTFIEAEKRNAIEQNQLIEYIDEVFPGGYHKCKYDKDLTLVELSNRFLDVTGFTEEEIRRDFEGKFIKLIHPEDLKPVLKSAELNFMHDKILKFTYRLRHKAKGYIWVSNTTRCVSINNERFFQSAIIDITDEMETSFELKKQDEKLNLVLENIPGGFNICYNDGKCYPYAYVSKELAKLFGYTVNEFMRVTNGLAYELCIKEDRAVVDIIKESLKASGQYKARYRVLCKDGSYKTIIDYGKASKDKDGKDILYSYLLDITEEEENKELIELQNKLLERERERAFEREKSIQQMELIQALAQDFSTVFTIDLDTTEVSLVYSEDGIHSQEEIKEYYRHHLYEESILTYINDFVYREDRAEFKKEISINGIRRNMADREIFTYNYRKDVNGEINYYQLKIVKLKSFASNNVVIGYKNVDDETRDMLNQKQILSDALSQAQYANRAKTIFLNNMSHDIRTPMNAIIGYNALAATHLDNKEKVKDYLKKINQSSTHLLSLINDVLDMSRIESGKIKIDNQPERISEIIHNVRNIIQTNISSRQLDLYIDTVDVHHEDVYCDKLRINQILINLLSNSMKFTKPGGVISLRIIEHNILPNGMVRYEFKVKDTGIGMSKEFLDHIFEPFVREKSSTVSGIVGTGLGMSITKSIVDMLGGRISVESELGKGTEFSVILDFKLQEEKPKKNNLLESLKGLRGLVVDNDLNTCQSVNKMLREIGLRSEWTMYGKEALARTSEAIELNDKYHVYIIDWVMPDMNGIEVTRQIRKIVGEDSPIIVLTAYDWADIEDEAREAGVTDFINKPLFMSDLESCLARCINPNLPKHEETPKRDCNRYKGKRLLLAEDNLFNQEIAIEVLTGVGFLVDPAGNGRIALDLLESHTDGYYDAILMDIQMPIMDGYEATSAIRGLENKKLASIPIIAMTANAFIEDKQKTIEAGMDGFISKPVNVDKLLNLLDKVL